MTRLNRFLRHGILREPSSEIARQTVGAETGTAHHKFLQHVALENRPTLRHWNWKPDVWSGKRFCRRTNARR